MSWLLLACGGPKHQAATLSAGDVRLMMLAEPGPGIEVVHAGGYTAFAGGVIAGCGLLTMIGAAALGGPAYDHSDVIVGGGVTFLIGTGVAVLGGLTALGGSIAGMKEEGVEDLGPARALVW